MAKIETLSLEVDGILPDTRVFRERCFLLDGAALYSFKAAPALVPQGRINLHDAQLALREEERATACGASRSAPRAASRSATAPRRSCCRPRCSRHA